MDRRIAEHLLEFGAELGGYTPAHLRESGGVHVLHCRRDGEVEVREVSGEELKRLRRFVPYFDEELATVMTPSE